MYDFTIRQMNIFYEGKKIYGEIYLPDKERCSAVIISHGLNGTHEGSQDIAPVFAANGIIAYIFDYSGGASCNLSDGRSTEMSVLTEARELSHIIDEIKKIPQVDPDRLFLLGKSQGCYVSTIVASQRNGEVAGLIGFYPGFGLQELISDEMKKYEQIPKRMNILNIEVSDLYFKDILSFDIYELMKRYYGNVLLIHGSADSIIPLSSAQKAQENFPHAKLIVIEGAEHGFHGPEREEVIQMAVDFIKKESGLSSCE